MAAKRAHKKRSSEAASAGAGAFPRLGWPRAPVQRAHSTPKGERGYDRKRAKNEVRREVDPPD